MLAFLLTLALSVGVIHFRQRQLVNEPLQRKLSGLAAVESVMLARNGSTMTVSVRLGYVDDLAFTHRLLVQEIEKTLGHRRYRLELEDRRDAVLEDAYYTIHLALYEAAQRGNFTEMGLQVTEKLEGLGIAEHRVVVTAENIYFQVRRGDSYLYAVIERETRDVKGEQRA